MSLMLQLCLEFVSNHISPASPQFKDFVEHGEASRYKDMFVRWEDVWPGGEGLFERACLGRLAGSFGCHAATGNMVTTITEVAHLQDAVTAFHAADMRLQVMHAATLEVTCDSIAVWQHMAAYAATFSRHSPL
jgi:hypothetical protein